MAGPATGSIKHEITGGEDGPVIETIDISGTQYSPARNVISTSSSSKKLHVRITDAETNS
ncbi:hypothetical protein CLV52_1006 [Amnibacterium kyonggiense]|uniref:Uncharacterized protein n=1 Tax=Amnibacterium kyonggiense TaxID=595671 RepID=A0A4R7FRJ9_9MICO|nr:hypothetical protein CLV52_1006 [Amnibacterium kyonggiense]